ncbi:MAG: hypothetical protein Q9169_003822 [Polycauliona sp. 2 TL-2023]
MEPQDRYTSTVHYLSTTRDAEISLACSPSFEFDVAASTALEKSIKRAIINQFDYESSSLLDRSSPIEPTSPSSYPHDISHLWEVLAIRTTALTIVWKIIHSFHERVVHRSPKKQTTSSNLAGFDVDGPADAALGHTNTRRRRQGGDVCAIFVHAGAGYHSIQNERIHLQACEHAAKAAMNVLSEGGGAVDAVEIAIRVLEDKEITNAGYGSNLSLDGTVECDATIVDHFGRSGAVGAVGQVQHPIHLARLILDYSAKPLSLRRVPPNLLAGPGATDFAESLHMPVIPPDGLISHGARERWLKWARDLKAAESRVSQSNEGSETGETPQNYAEESEEETIQKLPPPGQYDQLLRSGPYFPGVSQIVTPGSSTSPPRMSARSNDEGFNPATTPPIKRMSMDAAMTPTPPHIHWAGQHPGNDGQPDKDHTDEDMDAFVDNNPPITRRTPLRSPGSLPQSSSHSPSIAGADFTLAANPLPVLQSNDTLRKDLPLEPETLISSQQKTREDEPVSLCDDITDTVGAIAVDCLGNIAAGSSSGGIGMKHRGRIGPAALVGIGTAVIPIETEDPEKTSVATVTSGTGEHMATTMAASTCASRLYTSTRKSKRGGSESTDDDSAVKSFVERDFMGNFTPSTCSKHKAKYLIAGHPSVRNSYSAGGIGVLGLKKTNDGIWLYFAHNTDSFAMASMSSEESKPRSVMSRSKESNKVVSGGRAIRYHRVPTWPSAHHSTWPGNPDASPSPEQPAKRQKRTRGPPPPGLPPSLLDTSSDGHDPNESYKVAYKAKMREVYGSKASIADEIAGIRLRSRSSGASASDMGLGG